MHVVYIIIIVQRALKVYNACTILHCFAYNIGKPGKLHVHVNDPY